MQRFEIMTADRPQAISGRIYPLSVVEMIYSKLLEGKVPIVLGAPTSLSIEIERILGTAVNPRLDNGVLSAEVKPSSSPCGQMIIAMMAEELPFDLHASGAGHVDRDMTVQDYQFMCLYMTPKPMKLTPDPVSR